MAFPATLLMMRVGGALSVSDVVLAAAALPAVVLYKSAEAEDMRPLIWLGVIYQAALLPGLLLNPYRDNIQEWVHELFLVLGSLVVGWVVGTARTGSHGPEYLHLWLHVSSAYGRSFTGSTCWEPVELSGRSICRICTRTSSVTRLRTRCCWLMSGQTGWAGASG